MALRSTEAPNSATGAPDRRQTGGPVNPLRPRHSLSRRLLLITFLAVLCLEFLFFVPALANARREWLQRRVIEAQIAALSTSLAPGGALDPKARDELLRLSGTEAIRIETPGRTINISGDAAAPLTGERIDLPDENGFTGSLKAMALLFSTDDALDELAAPSAAQPESRVVVTLHRIRLARYLRGFAAPSSLYSLIESALAGLLVFAACHVSIVRPMRRLIESIHQFGADPEHAPPHEDARDIARASDDEIDIATRELAGMQGELRMALWRNARLAAIGTAVAKVSHDLRGVLSPAMLVAERLQSNADPAVAKAGGVLVTAVERAAELVRGPLDFAREGPAAPAKARVALRDVLAAQAEAARSPPHPVDVALDCDPALAATGDVALMERIFANLIRNAAEAGSTAVRIVAAREGAEAVVVVADDAGGLPDQVRKNLFKPFVTGNRAGGAGLGLAIVRDLVTAQGGTVSLLETGAKGTSFRVAFPAAAERTAAALADVGARTGF